jgi:8-oxo-dGTP pyrophosphatase MutT (NUDIX family)
MAYRHKVYAYLTRGDELLVFRHVDFPEAGIQVPGGTLEEGEDPAQGALREASEETGLHGLRLASVLGEHLWRFSDGRPEVHLRYFYHLLSDEPMPDTWRHYEMHPSDGTPGEILFEFFWTPLSLAADVLHPYYVAFIAALQRKLGG